MKLTDKAILRMVSESPGRNTSEPIGGPDQKIDPRGRVFSCRTKATGCVANTTKPRLLSANKLARITKRDSYLRTLLTRTRVASTKVHSPG